MAISDQEVSNILFNKGNTSNASSGQPSTGIPDDEVKSILAGSQNNSDGNDSFDMTSSLLDVTKNIEASPLTIKDRISLSFADDNGRESNLRKKFLYVEKLPNGKFAVGNNPKDLLPIDPEGMFNDVLGDLADVVSEIPVVTGQIIGTSIGSALGNVPGAITGSAVGSGVGESVKKTIGKAIGVNEQDAAGLATDIAISSAFGAVGEGVGQGTRIIAKNAKKVLAPKLTSLLSKASQNAQASGNLSRFDSFTSKIFKYLANIPEESTETFQKYGWKEMDNPEHFDKNTIIKLVDDAVKNLDSASSSIGQEVNTQKNNLISAAKRAGANSRIETEDLFKVLKAEAQQLDILDNFGRINKKYPNSEEVRPLLNLLKELGTFDKGKFVIQPGKTIPIDKALKLSSSFGQKFDKVTPRVQRAFSLILNGDKNIGFDGLRGRITNFANKVGLQDFAKANQMFSRFSELRDALGSLDTKNLVKIENFISRLESIGSITKRDLYDLEKYASKPFIKNWELWNAAQDFNKTDLNVLRFGSIAAIIGGITGFQSRESKIGTIGGAALLGTPAGLRTLIRGANRAGNIITKQNLQSIGQKTAQGIDSKMATALLSRLLQQKSREPTTKNKYNDKNNK